MISENGEKVSRKCQILLEICLNCYFLIGFKTIFLSFKTIQYPNFKPYEQSIGS